MLPRDPEAPGAGAALAAASALQKDHGDVWARENQARPASTEL